MTSDLFRREMIFAIVVSFVVACVVASGLIGYLTWVANVQSLSLSVESLGVSTVFE